MSKALRIKIIDHLREKDAVAKYVDIRAHLLNNGDSVEHRNEVKATLDHLSNKKLIVINGSYEFLHWAGSKGLYNLDNKIISAKLTARGQAYHPENDADEMEAAVHPVLATTPTTHEIKNAYNAGEDSHADVAVEHPPVDNYPLSTPIVVAPSAATKPTDPQEPVTLPWYEEKPTVAEATVIPVEATPLLQPSEPRKEPVVYKFPPVDFKTESIIKPTSPMVIEILNDNLSNSIDAISNIKIKKPAALTGDFEKDVNIILKFVLVVALFLFFACIVWLYLG